jgi:colicin import membrane protein
MRGNYSRAKEAQIPPAPDEQTYQTFNNAVMDFRP